MSTLVLEHLQHANSVSPDLTVDANGNIGLGTVSPVTSLDVRGEVSIEYNSQYGLRFYNQDRNNWSYIGNSIPSGNSYANLRFGDYTGEVMRMYAGNVGIKTTNPVAPLAVSNGGNEGWEIHPALINTNHNRITNYNRASNTYCDLTTDAASFIHRINGNSNESLEFVSNGLNLKSSTYAILNIQTDVDDNSSSNDGIIKISNGSTGITKAEFRWDESEDLVHISYGDHGRNISINNAGRVGIGTGSNGDRFAQLDVERADTHVARFKRSNGVPHISFENGQDAGLFRFLASKNYGFKMDRGTDVTAGGGGDGHTWMQGSVDGEITIPNQPSFMVHLNNHVNISGNQSLELTDWGTTQASHYHNTGGHFNTSNGRFTAPVTGRYKVDANIMHGTANGDYQVWLVVNGATGTAVRANDMVTSGAWQQTTVTGIFNLSAGDYVSAWVRNSTTMSYAAYGNSGASFTTLNGYLLG